MEAWETPSPGRRVPREAHLERVVRARGHFLVDIFEDRSIPSSDGVDKGMKG